MYTELLIIMSVHDTVAAGMLYFKMSTYFLKNDVKLWREREREKEKKTHRDPDFLPTQSFT